MVFVWVQLLKISGLDNVSVFEKCRHESR